MLKPPETGEPRPERPVGEIVHQLVEEGKAYAQAEVGLVKSIALAKTRALGLPAALLGAALLVAQAAVTVLAVGVYAALQWSLGSLLAAVVTFVIFGAIAGGLAWYAVTRVRSGL
jgi:Putative Actinobacterial Holin-X, holin superfamily III